MLSVTSLTMRAPRRKASRSAGSSGIRKQVRPAAIDQHGQRHAHVRHALDLRLDDGDGENQVAVVHDGLADARDGAGDAVVGRALAFLDLLGGLVHRAQHEVAAGRPEFLAGVRNSSSGMPATEAPDQ